MRVLVLGGGGMLGHKAFQVLSERFDTRVTFRRFDDQLRATGIFPADRVIDGVDATDLPSVRRAIADSEPACVLNCIGVIKQVKEAHDPTLAIQTNALFPHQLAQICRGAGARLIHISTDCVFSGRRGNYVEEDITDAEDLYGRTKALGEVTGPGTLTIRTSIIGRELFTAVSLVDWFLQQKGKQVRGFTNAIYTGLTSIALSHEIARVIVDFPSLGGLYQISSEKISKYELLLLLRDAFGIEVEIEPYAEFRCDRSLLSDRYRAATGFRASDWPDMVRAMAADSTGYNRFEQVLQQESS